MRVEYSLLEARRWNKLRVKISPEITTKFYGDWIATEDLAKIIDELFEKGESYQSLEKKTGIHARRIRAVKMRETESTNFYFADKFLTRMDMGYRLRSIESHFGYKG